MIRRNLVFGLLILCLLAFLLWIPAVHDLRGYFHSWLAPLWEEMIDTKLSLAQIGSPSSFIPNQNVQDNVKTKDEEIQRLKLEQQLLLNEIQRLQELYNHEHLLYIQLFDMLGSTQEASLASIMELQMQALPARVIYRPPQAWTHSMWINVGEKDNVPQKPPIVAVNSPVLFGSSIVGVIDYVGKKQSKVRLVTDPKLNPSVRIARGDPQNRVLIEHVDALLEAFQVRQDLLQEQDKQTLFESLNRLRSILSKPMASWYLAKGEMQGSRRAKGRSAHTVLIGTGFNYDFPDEKGGARDLRTGKPKDKESKQPTLPLLKVNDLLVTTGLDGVFPPGLRVGTISSIMPLKEGDYYYELEAKPTAGDLDELSLVFVIPPIGYDFSPLEK